jgi:hypothetical protein
MDGCTFSGYEVSDKGRSRSVDRKAGNRQLRGKVLAAKPHEDGYVLTTIRCDSTDPDHDRRHTVTMHRIVLTTFDRPRPDGMEACHSPRGPAFNWWPEGVRWGTKPENHADMVAAGNAVVPESFPCRNYTRCGGMARTQGRRCRPCVDEVGRDTVMLLNAGMGLPALRDRFGFKSDDWLYRLAVEHGYTGTKEQARGQHPSLLQRVKLVACLRHAHAS